MLRIFVDQSEKEMSWFGSIVNSLKLDDEHEDEVSENDATSERGVKEDLDEITKTLTRKFWGVASYLAPPPETPTEEHSSDRSSGFEGEVASEAVAAAGIDGIRSDFAEIGGKFKSGITKLSGAKAVSEFSKIASNILQLGSDQGTASEGLSGNSIGVTEEVVAFAKNIAMHPETWLDFPLADNNLEQEDFDMSDVQQEHALAVERLVPDLAALRFELCPEYVSEGFFWKIYFVLVHPRLDKHDADLISTPQILETRAMLAQQLQNRSETAVEFDFSDGDGSYKKEGDASLHDISLSVPSNPEMQPVPSPPSVSDVAPSNAPIAETDKYSDWVKDTLTVDKSVETEDRRKTMLQAQKSPPAVPSTSYNYNDEDDGDDWLKEEPTEDATTSSSGIGIAIPLAHEEDVSFSDLEEEDDTDVPAGAKRVTYNSESSTKSPDWVQLSRSSSDSPEESKLSDVKENRSPYKESNDWLNVEHINEM